MNKYRVVGDFDRLTYSTHRTLERAEQAARSLTKKWGWCHPGSEPCVEELTDEGWVSIEEERT